MLTRDLCLSFLPPLVHLQRRVQLLNPILRNDHHLQTITNLNMPLHRTRERIPHQLLHVFPVQRLRLQLRLLQPLRRIRLILVLKVDLVVQERHDQARRRTRRATLLPLVRPHGIVAVQRALALFIDPTQDGVDVVREEALVVEDVREALRAGVDRHVFAVLVPVHLHHGVQSLL